MNNVFVYGTLKSGHGNNRLLAECSRLGTYFTVQTFRMHNVGFPVTFYEPKGARVIGELYEIPDIILSAVLARLDRLEKEGRMYKRETVLVTALNSVEPAREAYMYVGISKYWPSLYEQQVKPNEHGMLEWGR